MGKNNLAEHFTKKDENLIESMSSTLQDQQSDGKSKDNKPSQADILIKIGRENSILFHNDAKDTFARILVSGHYETWPTNSKQYKRWLVRQFYEATEKAPGNEVIRQALNVLEAEAQYRGNMVKLSLRVAKRDGVIWYDLADENWRAVKIEPGGWIIESNPPILFRQYKNTSSQVMPKKGGNIELLKKYINLKNEDDWTLLIAFLVATFVPEAPHVIPVFYGDKGSAKTTAQRVLKKIIDPAIRDTMTLPTEKNELALMLTNNYAPCFDNLDGLSPWQSDMLCQAATGGGISKRELYTDTEEIILSFFRCPFLNGINNVVSRDDLLDRSTLFQLERIDPSERKEEAAFWEEFETDRPLILGAIFDILAEAMSIYPNLKLKRLPRMADFARWGYAITESAGDCGNNFLDAYSRNITSAVDEAIQADQVAAAVVDFINEHGSWDGTLTELLDKLSELPEVNSNSKAWPKRPHTLSRRINKMKASLADVGIEIEHYRREDARCMKLVKAGEKASEASTLSEGSNNGVSEHDAFYSEASGSVMEASGEKSLHNGHADTHDANDATSEPFTCCELCGEPIVWTQDENGEWLSLRIDYTGYHNCN